MPLVVINRNLTCARYRDEILQAHVVPFVRQHAVTLQHDHWTDFNIILQKCSFGGPLPRLFKPFGFVKKHGRQGMGLFFPIYLYRKLKKSSCQKPLDRFPYNFVEMFLWRSSTRLFKPFGFVKKHGRQGAGLIFPIYLYGKLKKSFCQKPPDRFQYYFAEMFIWWSSTKIVQAISICQKTWPPGAGLIFLIYLYRKLKKSSCHKPLNQFPYNFAEMFLWWSSTKIVQAIWIC